MMDEEDEHSPTSFIILRIWQLLKQELNRYHQKTINDFINQQKIEILFFIVPKVDKVTTTFGLNTFQYLSISSWNSLSDETRSAPDLNTFKRCIKQLTFKKWLHI